MGQTLPASELPRRLLSSLAPSPAVSKTPTAVRSHPDTTTTRGREGEHAAARQGPLLSLPLSFRISDLLQPFWQLLVCLNVRAC